MDKNLVVDSIQKDLLFSIAPKLREFPSITIITKLNSDMLGLRNGLIGLNTITQINYYKDLLPGCYELQNASTTYFPFRLGTLLNFIGSTDYGVMIAIHTNGSVCVRCYSFENDKWYSDWIEIHMVS